MSVTVCSVQICLHILCVLVFVSQVRAMTSMCIKCLPRYFLRISNDFRINVFVGVLLLRLFKKTMNFSLVRKNWAFWMIAISYLFFHSMELKYFFKLQYLIFFLLIRTEVFVQLNFFQSFRTKQFKIKRLKNENFQFETFKTK